MAKFNIYHKGRFRGEERGKHLRPYLKRLENKRFRKAKTEFNYTEDVNPDRFGKKNLRRQIKVKFTIKLFGKTEFTYIKSYKTLKDARNAINRNNVVKYKIIKY